MKVGRRVLYFFLVKWGGGGGGGGGGVGGWVGARLTQTIRVRRKIITFDIFV